MAIEALNVSEETRARACDCPHDHACLSAETRSCCSVVDSVGNAVFVDIHRSGHESCPYRVSFGAKHRLCTCPLRNEIHARYGI
jgi:hypothetical protein